MWGQGPSFRSRRPTRPPIACTRSAAASPRRPPTRSTGCGGRAGVSLRLLETAGGDDRVIHPFEGETALFITPGYRFRAVDVMMTNFHLPRSTLFMLVAAFCG